MATTRTHFKTPEGKYVLLSERYSGLIGFHANRTTKLTLAEVRGHGELAGRYIVFNVGDYVHVSHILHTDRVGTFTR